MAAMKNGKVRSRSQYINFTWCRRALLMAKDDEEGTEEGFWEEMDTMCR